jgi:ELWxxDGT repeat protein
MKIKLLLILLMVAVNISAQQEIYTFDYSPSNFIKFNNNILFVSTKEDSGAEIWQSDGTSLNTTILKDINLGKGNGALTSFKTGSAILNGKLFFFAKDETSGGEIWKTDGTANGTVKVTNFLNGRVVKLTTVGTSIYFLLKTEDFVLQVWKTDGTTEGTIMVKDNLAIWNKPTFEGKCNNTFIFTFQPYGTNKSRVWRSDGTSGGTFPITEEIDGNGSGPSGTSELTQYIEKGNKLYFVSRYYLFETDGTLENTKSLANLYIAQTSLVNYSDVIEVNNNLYFMFFFADSYKLEIWKFDLTTKMTSIIYRNISPQYFYPSNFMENSGSLLFSGPNSNGGTSLLSMNLNNYGVSGLKELSSSAVKPFVFRALYDLSTICRINSNEYFIASGTTRVNGSNQSKGWISNATLQTIESITALDNVQNVIAYNDYLYYGKDNKLWKYANNLNTKSIDNKPLLMLYPNPSTDFIQVNMSDNDTIESVNIFDLNGKLVSNLLDYKNNKIDISKLALGVYNLQIKFNGKMSISKKIIKK